MFDVATVRARSQSNTLLAAHSTLTTDNAAPAVAVGPIWPAVCHPGLP
ncbi:MAG: hypothetical protein R3E31_18850 [Chloroflexota bacterium]